MDAAGELAQLGQRGRQSLRQVVDRRILQPHPQHAQLQRERDELLLGAVVQVALDPAARRVAGLHDPQARHAQLLHARLQVGLQTLVVERQRSGRGGGRDQLRGRVERGVVDDRGDAPAVAVDRGPGPARARLGQRDRVPGLIHEALAVGQPVDDVHRPVAEALGQHLAHRAARRQPRRQQRVGGHAQDAVERLERGQGERRRGRRQREQDEPEGGAERPRPDVVQFGPAGEPADAEVEAEREREHGGEPDDEQRGDERRAQRQVGGGPPQRAVREQLQRAPEPPAGPDHGRGERRNLRGQPAVRGAPVQPLQPAARGRRGGEQRQPDPGHAERRAEDQHQHRRQGEHGHGQRHDQVGDRVPGAREAAVELQRADHERPSTNTSPDVLRTWTLYGAASVAVTPRTRSSPELLSASRS